MNKILNLKAKAMKQLTDLRDSCQSENRSPTSEECRKAEKLIEVIDNLDFVGKMPADPDSNGLANTMPNNDVLGLASDDLDRMEIVFQVSLKMKIARDFEGTGGNLYTAYTNRSWWQAYNSDRSSPFRETNHEPELFLHFDTDFNVLGLRSSTVILGVSHQSNGQGGDLSRSWNRIYLNLVLEKGRMAVSVKPWYRIPEEKKRYPEDPSGDDNPDIGHFMGHGELGFLFAHRKNTFTLMFRNNFRADNKGAVGMGWSYPLSSKIKGYLRVFDGYGESLIDYNHRTTRIGLGFLFADWL